MRNVLKTCCKELQDMPRICLYLHISSYITYIYYIHIYIYICAVIHINSDIVVSFLDRWSAKTARASGSRCLGASKVAKSAHGDLAASQ